MRRFSFFLMSLSLCLFSASVFAETKGKEPSWWPLVLKNTDMPLQDMENVLVKAYQVMIDKSIKPLTARYLATESLKSLETLDEKFRIYPDGKRLMLIVEGKILKSWEAPADDDTVNWTRVLLASLVEVRPHSKKARRVDNEELLNIFLNASLAKIDSYSHYEGPDRAKLKETGNKASLGIRFRRIGQYLEITDILPGSPASESLLAIGDRVVEIQNEAVSKLSRIETLNRLQGDAGEPVTLLIRKDGKISTVTVNRAIMPSGDITYFFDKETKILTVKIPAFTEKTTPSLLYTLNLPESKTAKGIIVDLRGNMGGLLRDAVLTADLFLPENTPLLTTKGRLPESEEKYGASEKEHIPQQPLVILIDAKTASSAEFFAAILQDTRKAVLVGTPTYGKARIQTSEILPNNGELYLTWAKYYLPSGYTPDALGIYPNVCTSSLQTSEEIRPLAEILPKSEEDKTKIRELCPPKNRKGETHDDEIASRLIQNKELFDKVSGNFLLDSALK